MNSVGSFSRTAPRPLRVGWQPLALVAGFLMAACGGDSGGGPAGSGGTGAGGAGGAGGKGGGNVSTQPQEANYRPCGRDSRIGDFAVSLKISDESSFTIFQGSVRDGVNPLDSLQETSSSGVCRLLNRKINQCTPACSEAKPLCGASGCVAFPVQQDVGSLTVAGVGNGLTITPSKANFYSNDGVIAYPGVTEGNDVILSSSGGTYPPFMIAAKGIAPLEMTTKTAAVKKGMRVSLAWKAPGVMTGARIHIIVSLDNHGTTPQQIECDAPDTGSFTIPASLVDSLSTLGVSGFPTMIIERRSVESKIVGPGCVELNVSASTVLDLEVEGVKSCKTNDDCLQGQTCQVNLTCK